MISSQKTVHGLTTGSSSFSASATRRRRILSSSQQQRTFHKTSSQYQKRAGSEHLSSLASQAYHYAANPSYMHMASSGSSESKDERSSPEHNVFSTSTASERQQDDDDTHYLTNKGQIEGVWIFFRHGDRSPSRPLVPEHHQQEEAEWWRHRLPKPDVWTTFHSFSQPFPPDIHDISATSHFLDSKRAPFGFLTHTGIQQTRENGLRLFSRYNNHGYHKQTCQDYKCAQDFLDVWNVQAYSTNYIRTVMSVQSFLDGLLGTNCYRRLQEDTENDPTYEPTEQSMADMRVPSHSSTQDLSKKDALVNIQVRGRHQDTLNAFDRNPELMADLVAEVISSPEFQQRDGAAAPLAARLANILPGLGRKKKNTTGFNAAPSGKCKYVILL